MLSALRGGNLLGFLSQLAYNSGILSKFVVSVLAKPLNNAQIVRGVFVYTLLNMANLIPFTKQFESSENLVDLLESRGLQICDRNKAILYLDNIGYYRLSAYMYPLLKMPKTEHLYKNGATFKQVMMLYRFDKKLLEMSMPFIATSNKIAYANA